MAAKLNDESQYGRQVPTVSVLREPDGSHATAYDLASEVTQHHVLCHLFIETVGKRVPPEFKGRGGPYLLMEEVATLWNSMWD